MAFKYVPLLALIAVVSAGVVPGVHVSHPAAPVAHPQSASTPAIVVKSIAPQTILNTLHDDHYDPHNQYKFAYEINDEHTGDNHSHQEERKGDVVHGEYSLMDADGFKRIVQYTVDSHSGFNAVVNRIPLDQHLKGTEKSAAAPVYSYAVSPPTATVVKQYSVPQAYHQHH